MMPIKKTTIRATPLKTTTSCDTPKWNKFMKKSTKQTIPTGQKGIVE